MHVSSLGNSFFSLCITSSSAICLFAFPASVFATLLAHISPSVLPHLFIQIWIQYQPLYLVPENYKNLPSSQISIKWLFHVCYLNLTYFPRVNLTYYFPMRKKKCSWPFSWSVAEFSKDVHHVSLIVILVYTECWCPIKHGKTESIQEIEE